MARGWLSSRFSIPSARLEQMREAAARELEQRADPVRAAARRRADELTETAELVAKAMWASPGRQADLHRVLRRIERLAGDAERKARG